MFWFSSVTQSCLMLGNLMDCRTPSFSVHHQLPELAQTHVHQVGVIIQPCHPLPSPSPPAFNLAQYQGLFKWVSSSHQVAKVLEFQLQHSPSNEYSGLISFRMDWLDLLVVQGTLKSLLQHHSLKASIPRCSAFFTVQLSHPYMTTGKTIALTRQTFVGKAMSLLFNMLSRLVMTFLPRSKHLLISWLQSLKYGIKINVSWRLQIVGCAYISTKLMDILITHWQGQISDPGEEFSHWAVELSELPRW